MKRRRTTFTSLSALILAISAEVEASSPPELSPCEEQLARTPHGEAPALCLSELAAGASPYRMAATRRLRELMGKDPENPWFPIYLGRVKSRAKDPEELKKARELYLLGARLAHGRGMAEAELRARWGLCRMLRDAGQLEEEGFEVERAAQVADRSGIPALRLRADVLRALHWSAQGEFESAYLTLRRIQPAVESENSYPLLRDHLMALAKAAQQTGRFRETRQAYRLVAESAAAAGDLAGEAQARYGMAAVTMDEHGETPSLSGRQRVLELARSALTAARSAKRPSLEAQALWMLGSLGSADDARRYLDRCFAVAATSWERSYCRSALARRVASTDPGLAESAIQEALVLARQSGIIQAQTAFWSQSLRVIWALGPDKRAIGNAGAALDAIEALRDQQGGSAGQPGLFSTWADNYYWLSGRLLEAGQVERAFVVIERMRSRTLIDALGLSRSGAGASTAFHARRADLILDIAQVQRRLLDPGLGARKRDDAEAELGRLEIEEADLRARIARADPAFATLRRPSFFSLEQVRGALAADEALLSFQIAPWKSLAGDFGGGAWLLVSTRGGTKLYRLPGRTELRRTVNAFTGLFEERDGSESRGAAILYEDLLRPALAEMPAEVRRLVIVADDFLHVLPFSALRPEAGSAPLAARYEITLEPSATLWRRWRETRPAPALTPAIVFADPVTRLEKLPSAREEGESVRRYLGGVELLVGEEASESYLKKDGAAPFGLFHFATHAVTDDVNPERSAVYLSPGDPKEDGLLQIREIVDLELDGKIVVLSSCKSASGEILRGEGVMGLARAFFQAGAHTVVASLWPLRDDEGAALFDRFYLHLGRGRSVAAALQSAQRDRMEDGAPAAAWAGVVVLGDGDRVPVPGGRRGLSLSPRMLTALLAAAVLLSLGLLVLRRRRTQ